MAKAYASRSFSLANGEIKSLSEQYASDKAFPNPYRSGAYHYAIAALVSLGVNKPHPVAKVHEAFRKAAGNDWYGEWARKDSRNEKTGKDAYGRFIQNLKVLQRTKDYGQKLLAVGKRVLKTKGAVIDLSRDGKGGILVSLNSNSAKPSKAGRAEKASRKPSGGSKGKGKGRKASKVAKSVRASRKVVQRKPADVAAATLADGASK